MGFITTSGNTKVLMKMPP